MRYWLEEALFWVPSWWHLLAELKRQGEFQYSIHCEDWKWHWCKSFQTWGKHLLDLCCSLMLGTLERKDWRYSRLRRREGSNCLLSIIEIAAVTWTICQFLLNGSSKNLLKERPCQAQYTLVSEYLVATPARNKQEILGRSVFHHNIHFCRLAETLY